MWTLASLVTFGGLFDAYAMGLIGALGPGPFNAKIFTPTIASIFGVTGFASFIAVFFAGLFVVALCVSYIADILVGVQCWLHAPMVRRRQLYHGRAERC